MTLNIFIVLSIAFVFIVLLFRVRAVRAKKSFWQRLIGAQYKSTQYLCTKTEQNFLTQLMRNVPLDKYYISSKVRLADITMPVNRKNIALFNKVAKKHVDFVICNRKDSRIVACIELDDSSHNSKSARKRDSEKNIALTDANIALFRVKTSRNYSEKIHQIMNFLGCNDNVQVEHSKPIAEKVKDTPPLNNPQENLQCPRCAKLMTVIEMKGFINKGKSFKSCTECGFKTEPK